jgi:hypothetical protein
MKSSVVKDLTAMCLVPPMLALLCIVGCLPDSHPDSNYQQSRQKRLKMEIQNDLHIVKVGKCQYVLWYNGYGSDMEHYGACEHCANFQKKDK